jgi:lipoprotein-anchoring transpeptidase ErfK/SrfK
VRGVRAQAALKRAGVRRHCQAGTLRPVGTATSSYAATLRRDAQTFRRPGSEPFVRFGRLTQLGYPTTFAIVGAVVNGSCRASWYRVQVPIRPNGSDAYLRPGDVTIEKLTTRIEVDVGSRELTLYQAGKRALRTRVAVGSPSTPTPIGRFYVNQRIVVSDRNGPFGPAVLGLSAFSNVLTDWAQGGPIAIHGTNEAWSIGRAVSNGCIRVRNAILIRLFARTPGGTPVLIRR